MTTVRRTVVTVVAGAVLSMVAACAPAAPPVPPTFGPPLPPAGVRVQAGIGQVYVTGATPGHVIRVVGPVDRAGSGTTTATVDSLGSVAVRDLVPGATYRVEDDQAGFSSTFRVLVAGDNPPQSFYSAITMGEGLNYLPMRDGTLIAAVVRPPVGASLSDGPFPTVIEYSGYQIAAPLDPLAKTVGGLVGLPTGDASLYPSPATAVGSQLVRLAGYATVSVQLRGTGCSGGEGDLFDLPSRYDGYDVVETVAAQRWVQGGRVGMVGISFSGFSQLATASTRPPHLAAIAPMSVAGRLWDLVWPGGILNQDYIDGWLTERAMETTPAPSTGAQPYANTLVATDERCRYNQRLRLQTRDVRKIVSGESSKGADYDRRDFVEAMDHIDVPVLLSQQFQDEGVSAYVMTGLDRLTRRNSKVWVNLSSGHHNDSISPDTLVDLFQFLDLYVARRSPELKPGLYLIHDQLFGANGAALPLPSLLGLPYDEALRRWESQPTFRFGVERGREGRDGATGTRWSFRSSSFPAAGAQVQQWHLGAGGTLAQADAAAGSASWRSDPGARPATWGSGTWSMVPDGAGVGFTSAPFTATKVLAGPIAADLWVSSTAADTDLQVTITEVRPDGKEMLVNAGVQRASQRRIDRTTDRPLVPGFTFTDPEPLAPGVNHVRVQVLPVVHAFRPGSRIRVVVGPVGGDRERWRYDSVDRASPPQNTVWFGDGTPSSVLLPFVSVPNVPSALPTCPQVGQACRPYVVAANGG